MNIAYYFILLVVAHVSNLILCVLVPIITYPIVWLIDKIERPMGYDCKDWLKLLYRFRIDMVIQGVLRGLILVYFILFLSNVFGLNNTLFILIIFVLLSIVDLRSWKSANPILYEMSLLISPIIGYLLGFYFFLENTPWCI